MFISSQYCIQWKYTRVKLNCNLTIRVCFFYLGRISNCQNSFSNRGKKDWRRDTLSASLLQWSEIYMTLITNMCENYVYSSYKHDVFTTSRIGDIAWWLCLCIIANTHTLPMDGSAGTPSSLAWSLYKCAALWRAVYGPSATERPIGTICEEKGISSRFQVSITSRYDLSGWKWRKPPCLPSFLTMDGLTAIQLLALHSFNFARLLCAKLNCCEKKMMKSVS